MKSQDVRIWEIRRNKSSKRPSYEVRWKVAGKPLSKTFRTKALADSFRSGLVKASRAGEGFDTDTGLPDSLTEAAPSSTWFAFAKKYVEMKWPHAAPNSRDSMNETLAAVTAVLTADRSGRPSGAVLRRALRGWAFVLATPDEESEIPKEIANALAWVGKASLPLADLKQPATMRRALDGITLKLDGSPAAAETVRRKRAVLSNVMRYAVELGELPENPMAAVQWQPPKIAKQVDRRVVLNPRQARELLTALSYVGLYSRARGRRMVALFACMYYGGLRPAEAVGLRAQDCELPDKGWGLLHLHRTRPTAGKRWTGTGEVHDDRGLKNRSREEVRSVPIPPRLVTILREHQEEFGKADDGRLFRNERGGVLGSSSYSRTWEEARALALTPEQVASPLAGTPYDLRHAALSSWLNAGVDPTEVAERAGNSVDVLLSRYAKCLDGRQELANRRVEALLGNEDGEDGGDEG
ncbi:tyrosine-type recombinase/integrase [Streptomyces tubbatahanensis]|uniref:Tyrosine-type recombinase/integrase n=1 Tax=Streptomyces tubbatahanensis TaxID=2923272 RepID=A0ABY3XWY2_9ACTN|nr:tyrosine-type recombinase/integrase [Streptomyces tubbatahanensis]UNS98985.1 tyrosine-type recombinase/integrase [Streptomyces tubbatahanensis]